MIIPDTAGPELDALIGVTIFGMEYWPGRTDAVIPRGTPVGETMKPCHFWPVSTDIAAAWTIMDRFAARHRYLWLSYEAVSYFSPTNTAMHWKCTFAAPQKFNATGATAPLAICRAALTYVAVLREAGQEIDI